MSRHTCMPDDHITQSPGMDVRRRFIARVHLQEVAPWVGRAPARIVTSSRPSIHHARYMPRVRSRCNARQISTANPADWCTSVRARVVGKKTRRWRESWKISLLNCRYADTRNPPLPAHANVSILSILVTLTQGCTYLDIKRKDKEKTR